MKATGCWFDFATWARRRVTVGGTRRGGGAVAVAAWVLFEEGDDPSGGLAGPKMGRELGQL
jgi:hypothetical protein